MYRATGLLASLTIGLAISMTSKAQDNALTIYSSATPGAVPAELYRPSANWRGQVPGFAMVRHLRSMDIERGTADARFADVSAMIDPTTVTFESLSDPDGTRVLEQSFEFDLVSQDKLLQRYLGQEIVVEQARGEAIDRYEGTLLGTQGGLILQLEDGRVQTFGGYSNILFPELPGGLMTRPTLVWRLQSKNGGEQDVRVSYESAGMTWWADYNIVYREQNGRCNLDLSAWVSIINQSGAGYPNAKLKLIAGDVNRAQPTQGRNVVRMAEAAQFADAAGFEEKAFFEYHLYSLGRATDLPDSSTKQIELFPTAQSVDCEKELVVDSGRGLRSYGSPLTDAGYGRSQQAKAEVFLRFKNSSKDNLGVPLPAGRIRVNQLDPADDTLEFIGEDVLDHTPRDEEVLVKVGSAFDVIAERKQSDYQLDQRNKQMTETFEISLRNRKQEDTTVILRETLYRWLNWEITSASRKWDKSDARRIEFRVPLTAGEETTVTYTVRYNWQ